MKVEQVRGAVVEAWHDVHVAVVDAQLERIAQAEPWFDGQRESRAHAPRSFQSLGIRLVR